MGAGQVSGCSRTGLLRCLIMGAFIPSDDAQVSVDLYGLVIWN
jgi:hypothetical protein